MVFTILYQRRRVDNWWALNAYATASGCHQLYCGLIMMETFRLYRTGLRHSPEMLHVYVEHRRFAVTLSRIEFSSPNDKVKLI